MTDKIEGKIATILSDEVVAINVGAEHGVQQGMKFEVLGPLIEIRDPDSKESIGSVSYRKTMIVVTRVEVKYSIAKNDIKKPLFNFPLIPVYTTKLPLEAEDRAEIDTNVRIGDTVLQISAEGVLEEQEPT